MPDSCFWLYVRCTVTYEWKLPTRACVGISGVKLSGVENHGKTFLYHLVHTGEKSGPFCFQSPKRLSKIYYGQPCVCVCVCVRACVCAS